MPGVKDFYDDKLLCIHVLGFKDLATPAVGDFSTEYTAGNNVGSNHSIPQLNALLVKRRGRRTTSLQLPAVIQEAREERSAGS